MGYITGELNQWAIELIEEKYRDDVALLIGRKHPWRIAPDGSEVVFSYFVPATDRGYQMSETFIIDDIGYDLFPRSWDRLEELSDLNGDIGGILDAEILYARTLEDRERFVGLQDKAKSLLCKENYCLGKVFELIEESKNLFNRMTFENDPSNRWMAAGYIADYLSYGIALINGTYFINGSDFRLKTLETLEDMPDGFLKLYNELLLNKDPMALDRICRDMILVTRVFMERKVAKESKSEGDMDELAAWYQELIYTFRRIRYYVGEGDFENVFNWGIMMQQELNYVSKNYGLEEMPLMIHYDPHNLIKLLEVSDGYERDIVRKIEDSGVSLNKYNNLTAFLNR